MATARAKADQAQQAAVKAQSDADKGRQKAYGYDPNFVQPGTCFCRPYRSAIKDQYGEPLQDKEYIKNMWQDYLNNCTTEKRNHMKDYWRYK